MNAGLFFLGLTVGLWISELIDRKYRRADRALWDRLCNLLERLADQKQRSDEADWWKDDTTPGDTKGS